MEKNNPDGQEQNVATMVSCKPSRYNHFYPCDDDNVLAYNAFSNSLASVPVSDYEIIERIMKKPDSFQWKRP